VPEGHVVSVTGPRRARRRRHARPPVPRLAALAGQAFQDTGRAIAEVLEAKASGIGTIVEMTPIGPGRRPDRMRAVAESTDATIIAASGYHRDAHYHGPGGAHPRRGRCSAPGPGVPPVPARPRAQLREGGDRGDEPGHRGAGERVQPSVPRASSVARRTARRMRGYLASRSGS